MFINITSLTIITVCTLVGSVFSLIALGAIVSKLTILDFSVCYLVFAILSTAACIGLRLYTSDGGLSLNFLSQLSTASDNDAVFFGWLLGGALSIFVMIVRLIEEAKNNSSHNGQGYLIDDYDRE